MERLLSSGQVIERAERDRTFFAEEGGVITKVHLARDRHHQRVALQNDDFGSHLIAGGVALKRLRGIDLVLL
jgi:putative heme iron utilization protein